MNITKNIAFILFSFLSTIAFAQNTAESDNVNGFEEIETELKSQKTVSYKIIYSQKLYTEQSFEFSEGIIVINDFNDQIQPNEIIETIARIGLKNKLTKIIAFRKHEAINLYFRQSELTIKQKDFLNNNLIAVVDIDLYKSLNKKEKKKHKKKRDLIESVSNESCQKLTDFSKDELSMEKINQVVSSTSSKYVEETMKAYEMSFEESVDEFLTDLTSHFISNCETMKNFAEKQYKE